MNKAISASLRSLQGTIRNALARAVVSLVDDGRKLQEVQVDLLEGETRDEVERFQNYGFTSNPPAGAEAIVVFLNGARDQGIAICVDDRRYRLRNLQPGEVAIYTDEGDKIVFKRGGTIEVTASTKLSIVAPDVEISGDLTVKGDIEVPSGDVTAGSISLKTHVHSGVQTGGGVTGAPQ
jgi:phage baseplate assembly protein V